MSGNLAIWRERPHTAVLNGEASASSISPPTDDAATENLAPSAPETGSASASASASASVDRPVVQLHFNLWRDFETASDFFDIGIQVKHTDQIRRLLLFVPGKVEATDVLDLNSLLKHPDSLNAVFNDIVNIVDHSRNWFDITKGAEVAPQSLRLHAIEIGTDLSFEPVAMDGSHIGTLLILEEPICRHFAERVPSEHYVRFRIKLTGELRDLFSRDVTPDDWWVLSSFMTTGITEFRLNERRTMPRPVIRRFDLGQLQIETIHYFLIRDLRHELVVQHKDFSKIRTLESDIWKHYLRGRHPSSLKDGRPIRRLSDDRLVIYHWKQTEKKDGAIDEFNAFAKFRSPRSLLWMYGIAIALLGAVGSALQAMLVSLFAETEIANLTLPTLPTVVWGVDPAAVWTFLFLAGSVGCLIAFFNKKRWIRWCK